MFGSEENQGQVQEISPTPRVERQIDPAIMQGLGITHQDIESYWERKDSVLNEALQNGSRAYNLLRGSDASVTALKLNEQNLIQLGAVAHNPEDYVQNIADLLQSEEHQPKSEQIKAHLQGFGLEASKDKNYRLIVKALNLSVNGKLVQDTKLLGMLTEKFNTVFGKDAKNELVALGYAIDDVKEIHPNPISTPTPSPTHQEASEQNLRPATPQPPGSPFGSQN